MTQTLFQSVLGEPFNTLPPKVRELHSIRERGQYAGMARITRGHHPLARLCAAIAGLPPSGDDVPTTVEFVIAAKGEVWNRNFGGYPMSSRLTMRAGRLCERLGPMSFVFDLAVADGEIRWSTCSVRLLDLLPLPARWFAEVRCREREYQGRYEFLVEASMPLIGRLIQYEGWLEPQ